MAHSPGRSFDRPGVSSSMLARPPRISEDIGQATLFSAAARACKSADVVREPGADICPHYKPDAHGSAPLTRKTGELARAATPRRRADVMQTTTISADICPPFGVAPKRRRPGDDFGFNQILWAIYAHFEAAEQIVLLRAREGDRGGLRTATILGDRSSALPACLAEAADWGRQRCERDRH